jgi:uncharacterized protein (DUF1810 family)
MTRLDRFRTAQSGPHAGFEAALHEIQSGRKVGHWIWYIFPQLSGLGRSRLSQIYAVDGKEEATEFLRDAELRLRLLTITRAVADRLRAKSPALLRDLVGSDVDAAKVVSSLTLFAHVAKTLDATEGGHTYAPIAAAAEEVLNVAATQGHPRCAHTRQLLDPRPSA